jgi:hypothetical protein
MMRLFRVVDTQTGAEPGLEEFALREPWAKGLIYCDMQGFSVEEDGTLVPADQCGSHVYPPPGRFRVEWLVPPDLVDSVLDLIQSRGLLMDKI